METLKQINRETLKIDTDNKKFIIIMQVELNKLNYTFCNGISYRMTCGNKIFERILTVT